MVRHRDMLQIALVRWFARSHWSCRYSDSLGLSTDHMEKTGFGWPHGPYFPRNLIIGRIPDIVAVTPCSFHQPTSLSIHFHGSAFRRPIHPPITISAFPLPCSGLPRMCPISTRSLFSTPSTALTEYFLHAFKASSYILFDYIPRISNFHSLDHKQRRCLGSPPFPIRFRTSATGP